jgi:proline iminopeptidase
MRRSEREAAASDPDEPRAGDHDVITVETARHIAQAIPNAELVTIKNCGHFTFLECADEVRNAFNGFFRRR